MEGTVQSQNRSILLGSHWKKIERLKDSAIGNSINHYGSDDEDRGILQLVMEKPIHFATCMYTAG